MRKNKTIIWKLNTPNQNVASVRYRALLPIQSLENSDYESRIIWGDARVDFRGVHAIIFVKSFSVADLRLAQDARNHSVPVILDLCDNIFIEGYGDKGSPGTPSSVFTEMARLATSIVTTGPALKEVISSVCGVDHVVVIPDAVETELNKKAANAALVKSAFLKYASMIGVGGNGSGGISKLIKKKLLRFLSSAREISYWKRLSRKVTRNLWFRRFLRSFHPYSLLKRAYKVYAALRSMLRSAISVNSVVNDSSAKRSSAVSTLLWYGNHGAPHGNFGMTDLLLIADTLAELYSEFDFELVVVSNSKEKYEKYIAPLPFATRYTAWDSNTIRQHIGAADVVLVPNSMDDFSRCKSANRSVLALQLDVPVVATKTPAMESFEDCVFLDQWKSGLVSYLESESLRQEHVAKAQQVIEENYSLCAIGKLWRDLLCDFNGFQQENVGTGCSNLPVKHKANAVAFCIGSKLDLDLLRPLIDEVSLREDWRYFLVIAQSVLEESVEVWALIQDRKLCQGYSVLSAVNVDAVASWTARNYGALISGVETNLRPHRLAHCFVQALNEKGVKTYTMQHGLDNVGLTYTDDVQPIRKVKFASDTVFTWLPVNELHPDMRADVRAKCVHAGCTKQFEKRSRANQKVRTIGVFENIHWHRYSDDYRKEFLYSLESLAKALPRIRILVKPHPAGLWLTERYQGRLPQADNIEILLPGKHSITESSSSVLKDVDAVITTPSTVALDAAALGLPVAIVSGGMELVTYSLLTMLPKASSWIDFVTSLSDAELKTESENRSHRFSDRYLSGGEAVENILSKVTVDLNQKLAS